MFRRSDLNRKKLGMVFYVAPATAVNINRRIVIQADLGIKQDLISILNRARSAGGTAQEAVHLPTKHKASQYHHHQKKKKKERKTKSHTH
jgi:hypothetical protein